LRRENAVIFKREDRQRSGPFAQTDVSGVERGPTKRGSASSQAGDSKRGVQRVQGKGIKVVNRR